jgi:two-component system sensor histidine kinase KdpD
MEGVSASNAPVSVVDRESGLFVTAMPLSFADGGSLQIEIGQDYAPIDAAADSQGDAFLPIVIIGLALLYIALFPTLAAASTRLRAQALELKHSLGKERERVEKMVQLEELQRNIANAASHELRTPLTVIRGNSEMLRDKLEQLSPEQLRGLVDGLDNQSAKLSRLVMDLLEADPLSDRIPEPRRERVDVADLVRGALENIWPPHRHIELPTDPVIADVDRRMVTRIIEALAINVLKYTPEGTPASFRVEAIGGGCRIIAQDEGPGIPKAEREQVFSLLTRRPDEAAKPGLGVGLALVRRYAEAHGGTATISEARRIGTRVEVTFLNGGNDLDRELARMNDSVN